MKWQDVSKVLAGLGTVSVVGLFSYLFLLTGMEYTHSGDSDCTYVDGIYQCNATINITTKYWNFEFEHLNPESYIYLPSDLKTFTGKLTRYQAGDLDFVPVLYKKSTYGRKLWVNLDRIDNIIDTQPPVKVDWMVPARGKDNWRHVKEGDTWDRLKNNRIKLIGYPENEFDDIIWKFEVGAVEIDPIWHGGARYETTHKKINGKKAVEIMFTNIQKEYNIKDEAMRQNKKPDELLNVKKTKYYGDVDIKLMHYVNLTDNIPYNCDCHNETIEYLANETNKTEAYNVTEWICDTCYKDVTNEIFQEIDPETFILKNNEPIYEVFGNSMQFEELPNGGWGYSVWTDVTIMGVEVENATWANATFARRKPVEVDNNDLEVVDYSFKWIVEYDSDMLLNQDDLRFANSTGTSLSYWIESIDSGVSATIWIKDPNLLVNSTNTTYYNYYDNTSVVSSESSFNDAFTWTDDAEDNTSWTKTSGTCTLAPSTDQVYEGTNSLKMSGSNICDWKRDNIGPWDTNDYAFGMSIYLQQVDKEGLIYLWNDAASPIIMTFYDRADCNEDWSYRDNAGAFQCFNPAWDIIPNRWTKLEYSNFSANDVDYYNNGNLQRHQHSSANPSDIDRIQIKDQVGAVTTYYDAFYIRKYLSTTPLYSFGAEETDTINYSTIACRTLDSAYGYYWLNASITNSAFDKCMNITANHVTLDCQGNTIDSDGSADYGIYVYRASETTTNITIQNCTLTEWQTYNIYMENSDYNYIYNTNSSNAYVGIEMINSDNNIIQNYTSSMASSGYLGIDMYQNSSNNLIDNSTFNLNHVSATGIYSYAESNNNIITNSQFIGTGIAMELNDYEGTPDNWTIYNNLFNTSANFVIDYIPTEMKLNTTNQTGTREYSNGTQIGGNYWAYPNGSGYSETCVDFDEDDFCDNAYTIDTNVVDYLPYTNAVASDFEVTESTGTLFRFYAYSPIQTEIEPYGQTSSLGMFTIENNLTGVIDIYAKLNETTSGVTLKLNDEYDYDSAISITTSHQQIYDDLAVSGTGYIWAWADFDNLQSQFDPKLTIKAVTY